MTSVMNPSPAVDDSIRRTEIGPWQSMVESLMNPAAWPVEEGPIERVQTHISAVLLGRHLVLKLKKPVDFGFLDYTTREKRRRACEAEVTLNRRLCPDTYLGVQPIVESDGQVRLGVEDAAGGVIDYGVLMKRLPAERMLDRMVTEGTVTEGDITRVALRVAAFHRTSPCTPDIARFGGSDVIRGNWQENFAQTARYAGRTLDPERFGTFMARVWGWMAENDALLRGRVDGGWIRDGHGDLRCEGICIAGPSEDDIKIYDCIEFNDRFRYGDVASEVAFLAMDLDARGRADLGYLFTERYAEAIRDPDLFQLLPFYRGYRAYVRGKVASFCLNDPGFSAAERDRAADDARRYFELAERYARRLQNPTVIVVCGLSGTGKTSIARAIAGELGLRVVTSDSVRREWVPDDDSPSGYNTGRYRPEANRKTYDALIARSHAVLKENRGVVIDATFRRAADRSATRLLAEASGADWRLIECTLSPEAVRRRLSERAAQGYGGSEATWEIYLRQRDEYEAIGPDEGDHLVLENGARLVDASRMATDWLRACDDRL